MKKMTFILALAIFCISFISGQNSTDIQIKDEIISVLKNRVEILEKEIEYYKETLDLLNSSMTAQDQDVEFKINSVIGNSNTGQIVIEGILINNGVLRSIQGWQSNAFDPQGNEIRALSGVSVGAGGRIAELHNDIPAKFRVEFKNTIPKTPMFRSLTIKFYSSVGIYSADLSVMFRNIPIEWK